MGRELTNVDMDGKPNGVVNSNGNLRVSEGSESSNYGVKECTAKNSVVDNGHEKQEVLGVKSTDFGTDVPEDQKCMDNDEFSATASKTNGAGQAHHATSKTGANGTTNVNSVLSPTTTKGSEVTPTLN